MRRGRKLFFDVGFASISFILFIFEIAIWVYQFEPIVFPYKIYSLSNLEVDYFRSYMLNLSSMDGALLNIF